MSALLEGLLLVDKPTGPTSHDIVSWVRRATRQKRVGHSGTLDPPASGLLVLALGRATRLMRFLPARPKAYEGVLALGLTTDTDDLAGETLTTTDAPLPDLEPTREAARAFLGRQLQYPPAVSARKVDGQRLYRLARQGRRVEAPPAEIEVLGFELEASAQAGRYAFRAEVSSGTYIRSLARDLGEKLGCGGALAELRRTAIGPFRVADAVPPPERGLRDWAPETLIPLDRVPLELPTHRIDAEEVHRLAHGRLLTPPPSASGWLRLEGPGSHLVGVGEITPGGLIPRVVLVDP